MRQKNLFVTLLLILILVGCNNDLQVSANGEEIVDVSTEPLKLVLDFCNDVGLSKVRSVNLVVDNCEKRTYTVAIRDVMQRSATDVFDSTQVDVHYMKFHRGDVPGFAIVSNDSRINKVYVFCEEGEISDTAHVVPLKWAIDEIPGIVAEDIQIYYKEPKIEVNTRALMSVGPLLKTAWDQGSPYNRYILACSSNANDPVYLGHCRVGCVPTAIAQVIAYCKRFKGTYYGNRDIDFDMLTSVELFDRKSTSELATQAATFVHEVAMYCQVEFGCGSSGSDLKSGYQYLKDLGYTCVYEDGNKVLDLYRLYSNLSKGMPHLIAGRNGDDGHAWVVDGIKSNSDGSCIFHCNWGTNPLHTSWVSDYRRPNNDTYFNTDKRHIYITGY